MVVSVVTSSLSAAVSPSVSAVAAFTLSTLTPLPVSTPALPVMTAALAVLLLSVGARGLGVLLSGSTENSMRRQMQYSGVRKWGRGKREYKHNLKSHIETGCSVRWGVRGGSGLVWSSSSRQTLNSPALLQPCGCCAGFGCWDSSEGP